LDTRESHVDRSHSKAGREINHNSAFEFMDLRMEDLDQEIRLGSTVVGPAQPLLKASSLSNEYFYFSHDNHDKFFVGKR
jgi:hypothetical protein